MVKFRTKKILIYQDLGLIALRGDEFKNDSSGKALLHLSEACGFDEKYSIWKVCDDGCFVVNLRGYWPFFLLSIVSLCAQAEGFEGNPDLLVRKYFPVKGRKLPKLDFEFEYALKNIKALITKSRIEGKLKNIRLFLSGLSAMLTDLSIELQRVLAMLKIGFYEPTEGAERAVSAFQKAGELLHKMKKENLLDNNLSPKVSVETIINYIHVNGWGILDKKSAETIDGMQRICPVCKNPFDNTEPRRVFCENRECQKQRNRIKTNIYRYRKNKLFLEEIKSYKVLLERLKDTFSAKKQKEIICQMKAKCPHILG